MNQSIADRCKTPTGQLIIFSIIMVEMALSVYLFVILGFQAETPQGKDVYNSTTYRFETKYDPIEFQQVHDRNEQRQVVLFAMIDIPILGGAGLGFVFLAVEPVTVQFRILKIMALIAVALFILFVIFGELSLAEVDGVLKVAQALGIMLIISVLGSIVLVMKEVS